MRGTAGQPIDPYRVIPASPSTGKWSGPWAVHLIGPRGGNNRYLGRITLDPALSGFSAERAVLRDVDGYGKVVEFVPVAASLFPTRDAAAEAIWEAS